MGNKSTDSSGAKQENKSCGYNHASSKIKKIYIPLSGFRYFHKPSDVDEVDPRFVGRERILQTLKNWLRASNGNDSGSYLITGYRGMGKSSLVGKVIHDLVEEQKKEKFIFRTTTKLSNIFKKFEKSILNDGVLFILILASLFSPVLINLLFGWIGYSKGEFSILTISVLCYFTYLGWVRLKKRYDAIEPKISKEKEHKSKFKINTVNKALSFLAPFYYLFPVIFTFIAIGVPGMGYDLSGNSLYIITGVYGSSFIIWVAIILFSRSRLIKNQKVNPKYIHEIRINLGSEVSDEKEILALIANKIRTRLDYYCSKKLPKYSFFVLLRSLIWSLISLLIFIIYSNGMKGLDHAGTTFLNKLSEKGFITGSLHFVNDLLKNLSSTPSSKIWFGLIISSLAAILIYKLVIKVLFINVLKYIGLPIVKTKDILSRLALLCERIDSSVDEKNNPYGSVDITTFNLKFKHKKKKKYEKASVREIEQELIEIINEIENSWLWDSRFIIVLDELDKINFKPSEYDSKEDKENPSIPEFSFEENGLGNISYYRRKQQLLYLLGQMKYFINTAKAKFVFISGHELYDAYLADVSDREFSVSSIFNGVINVDSFFSYNSGTKDITKMTEIYLCKQLMEQPGVNEGSDISKYGLHKYLEFLNKRLLDNTNQQMDAKKREIEKLIIFLKQFVTYLTFVSNGAPKKITTNFEKYIISKAEYKRQCENENKGQILNVLEEDQIDQTCKYYLSFGYRDQQKIGFIHYMTYPIFETIISPSSEYGDKLLVSSSFLIAHIYKHHNSGFSWRNLEYVPELIESNRTPELRGYISTLIGYLGQIYLSQITSGIYHYKFPMKLVEEISVFTKRSEEVSSIFNFSLDDSRDVKQYYQKLLDYHIKRSGSSPVVVANLYHYLGDIHMAHDEYTEAISQYRQAADSIYRLIDENENNENGNKASGMSISMTSLIVRYTRAVLKLGLAYEKRNTMDSAFMVYNDLTLKLVTHRDIDESKFALNYKTVDRKPEEYWKGKRILFYNGKIVNDKLIINEGAIINAGQTDLNEKESPIQFNKVCHPSKFDETDQTHNLSYWIYGEELTDNLCDFLTPQKSALISKLSVYEDLRLAYLPILAKLFSVEKQHICGITKDNIKIAESEFRYLFMITNSTDKYILSIDFYRKMGDILYYKNMKLSKPNNSLENMFASWGYDIKADIFDYCYQNKIPKSVAEKIIDACTKYDVDSNQTSNVGEFDEQALLKLIKGNYLNDDPNGYGQNYLNDYLRVLSKNIPKSIKSKSSDIINCCNSRGFGICNNSKNNCFSTPCYACRYYSRSLTILQSNLLDQAEDNRSESNTITVKSPSRALKFLEAIKSNRLKSSRQNELTQAALTLDAMGNIMVSCSRDKDKITGKFIRYFLGENVEQNSLSANESHSNYEKAILYYWAAMEFHYKASNNKEGVQCLIKILALFSVYFRTKEKMEELFDSAMKPSDFLAELEQKYIRGAIEKTFANHDYYGIVEANKLKEVWKMANHVKIKIHLGLTSIMPDIEEIMLKYYELKLRLDGISGYSLDEEELRAFYQSPSLTYLRNDSLTYNRVISLLFKINLNSLLWKRLPICEDKDKKIFDWCFSGESVSYINGILCGKKTSAWNETTMNDIVEFLISDTILCLSYITDFLTPTVRTTLFTNSFCGGIYENLHRWNLRKEMLQERYKTKDTNRLQIFKELLDSKIDIHIQNKLSNTYLGRTANKFYCSAIEMHSEGQAYKDFINGLYILDDDLQNNTCQFFFGLERYKINIGDVYEGKAEVNMNEYFDPKEYFEWPEECEECQAEA